MKNFKYLVLVIVGLLAAATSYGTITTGEKELLNTKMGSVATKVQLGTLIQNAETITASEIPLANGSVLIGNASNVAVANAVTGDIAITNTGVASIAALAVVNADVSATAAIDFSKLAALSSTNILVGSAANVPTSVAVTGDVTIGNTGVTAIGSGVIVNADVSGSAAIDYSKMATMTGDVTMTANASAIGAGKVVLSMVDRAVVAEATGTLTQANLLAAASFVEAIAAPGAGKIIIVDEVELFHDYAVAAYATGSDLALEYGTSGDNITLVDAATFVHGTADASAVIKPSTYDLDGSTGTGFGFDVTLNANKPVQFQASNFTNGDVANIIKYRIRYHTVTLLL